MRICVEMYFDIEAITDDRWNVVLWESDSSGEPIIEGWEHQPFGERRFLYRDARQLVRRIIQRLDREHQVSRLIGVAQRVEQEYPRSPTVYRTELRCESLDYNDTS